MNLHLVNDEKIINRTIDMFEKVWPGDNLFVVFTKKPTFSLVSRRDNVISIAEFKGAFKKQHYDKIFIHNMKRRKMNLVNSMDTADTKVYWIVWGADLYNKLLEPKGFPMFAPGTWGERHSPGAFSRWVDRKKAARNLKFIKEKVDYIVTDTTDNDFDYLKKYYPELASKPWRDFFYYPIDVILGKELINATTCGDGIMVGNSASITNNHQYVFERLSKLDLGGRHVVTPLSYNGKPKYIKEVCRTGEKLFGSDFEPLHQFMPLEEYNRLQAGTGYAFFGNFRQEAIGNILIVLYLGAKVFLCRQNPVYEWAQSKGLKVFDLDTLTQADIDTPLDEETRAANRRILTELYNEQRLYRLISEL